MSDRRVEFYEDDRQIAVFTLPETATWVSASWPPKEATTRPGEPESSESRISLDWNE